jgi:hypothetical protein
MPQCMYLHLLLQWKRSSSLLIIVVVIFVAAHLYLSSELNWLVNWTDRGGLGVRWFDVSVSLSLGCHPIEVRTKKKRARPLVTFLVDCYDKMYQRLTTFTICSRTKYTGRATKIPVAYVG